MQETCYQFSNKLTKTLNTKALQTHTQN